MPLSPLWVKVSTQLPRHPKTIKAAENLGITAAELVGRLCFLWIYCAEFRPSGYITGPEELAAAMDWQGDAHALALALKNIPCFHGFIDSDENFSTGIRVHDWDVFNSGAASGVEKRREKKMKEENAREARDHENMNLQKNNERTIPEETKKKLDALFRRSVTENT